MDQEDGGIGHQLKETCDEWGISPTLAYVGSGDSFLHHMVAAGLGIALTPEHTPILSSLVKRPLQGSPLRRCVYLIAAKNAQELKVRNIFFELLMKAIGRLST